MENPFKSENTFFHQDPYILKQYRGKVENLLVVKGYNYAQIQVYLRAYDYFTYHKESFDGATMTEDLCDIPGLDLDAMLHDYLYIKYNAAGSYKYICKADKLIRTEMYRKGKSTINAGLRFVLLVLKTFLIPYPLYSRIFKGRKMSDADKEQIDHIISILSTKKPEVWHKEYRGELVTTILIFIIIILLMLSIF